MQNELKFECQMRALNPKSGLGGISRIALARRRLRNAAGFEIGPRTEAGGDERRQNRGNKAKKSLKTKDTSS
jgi:hypothetical protein